MHFIIADDHPFSLAGLKAFVEELGYVVLAACSSGDEAFSAIKRLKPDFAILDISMPGMDGLQVLESLRLLNLHTKVIFLTNHNEMSIYKKACEYGVDGYLLKNYAQEELAKCLQSLMRDVPYLSDYLKRDLVSDSEFEKQSVLQKLSFVERKVFQLVVQQKSTKEIAEVLFLSEKTVEAHRTNIIDKLDLPKERNSLLKFAARFVG